MAVMGTDVSHTSLRLAQSVASMGEWLWPNMHTQFSTSICISTVQFATAPRQLHTMPDSVTSAASPAPSSSSNDGYIWDVQEILAERTSVSGENEFLVVWKPTWIPVSNMAADGPVVERYSATPKWAFSSAKGALRIYVPTDPGTLFAHDCATIAARAAAAETTAQRAEATRGKFGSDLTPRKALGGVVKRKKTAKE